MQRYLPFLIIAAVGLGTVAAGSFAYRAKLSRLAAVPQISQAAEASDVKIGAKPPHIRGDGKAKVTIEEFADFQCPPCAALSSIMGQLEKDYHGRLRVIFRHYPLPNHQHARPAALAAEAAGLQGRFWEMHDLLYRNRSAWSAAVETRPLFGGYAAILELDMDRFSTDLERPDLDARITADKDRAASLGVKQTPTLFLNNKLVPVASLTTDRLRELIDAALTQKPNP